MASVRQLTKPNREGKRPWVVEYTNPTTGKRVRATPPSGLKKDADALRRKIEAEVDRGEHVAKADTATIAAVAEDYMRRQEERQRVGSLRRTTVHSDLCAIRACIVPYIGKIRLADLTKRDVLRFYEDMILKRKLKPNSARVRIKILRNIEEFGKSQGLTARSTVDETIKELPRQARQRVREFTIPQVEALLRTAALPKPAGSKTNFREHARYEVVVNIAAYCGLRLGEIHGLRRDAIDLVRRRLYVRQQVNRFQEIAAPKTDTGNREVPMPPRVASLIEAWLEKWYIENEAEIVFTGRTGTPVTGSNFFSYGWRPLLERAGLGDTEDHHHFHALRGFTISWMIENGIPPATVAKLVGHRNVKTTLDIYTRTVRELDAYQDDFDRIAGLLKAPMMTLNATETRLLPVSA